MIWVHKRQSRGCLRISKCPAQVMNSHSYVTGVTG